MKYYISDLHLFHENAIKFDHRPFESVQEMHEVVMKNCFCGASKRKKGAD